MACIDPVLPLHLALHTRAGFRHPDLAFIMGLWDRLADECKARLIEVIRENLPSETLPRLSDQRSAVNDRNHREGQKVQMNPLSKGC